MRKFFGLLLVSFVIVGCGFGKKEDLNTITVWHWMTDRHQAFEELARRYEQQTGIKIKFDLYAPSDAYSQKVIASAQSKILPDIYGILDKKQIFASFIESGFVADLTDEFAKDGGAWEKSIFPKALNVNRFEAGNVYNIKPGIYGVPLDVTNIQMLYNKNLLKKAGVIEPPKTFAEFLNAAAALKRVGVGGLVAGWGELWMIECFATNFAFNIMGEEKVMATYSGQMPYTSPEWIEVFRIFEQLRDAGALAEGIVTKPNKYAEQDFALERAAFTFNGSWCVNVYRDMNSKLEYGVMLPPSASTAFPMRIWGGAGSSFVINANSVRKDKAVAFLKWLTAKDQQVYLATQTMNLPSNSEALESIPEVLADFAAVMEQTTHPTIWQYNESPIVAEKFNKGIQSIIIGEKTAEQVAREVQAAKEKEMLKAQRR